MTRRFVGKVAIVTGASRGIGKATALCLAGEGAAVVVANRDRPSGLRTTEEINGTGGTAAFCQVDVGDSASNRAMVDFAVSHFGGLDVFHANAAIDIPHVPFVEHTDEAIENLTRVNFVGVLYGCRAAIPALVARGGGSIVVTSSRMASQVPVLFSVYGAAKAALNKFVEALALECGPQGIRVNAVAPGVTLTEMWRLDLEKRPTLKSYYEKLTPLHRWGTPEDTARAVAFLASDDAGYVTGVTLAVDGGLNLRQAEVALQEALAATGPG